MGLKERNAASEFIVGEVREYLKIIKDQQARINELEAALEQLFDKIGYIRESKNMNNALLFPGFRISEDGFIPGKHKKAFRSALEALAIAKQALSEAGE